ANPTSMPLLQIATATLNEPAATDNSTLSVSSWRQRRQRPEPIDIRTAISFRRADARASSRVATFTHAISSTSPPIDNKTQSEREYLSRFHEKPLAPDSTST